jgi:hypothetical protein
MMRPETLGIKLDKDLLVLWDDIDQKADAELKRVINEGKSAWSADLDTLADAHVALLSKQINRNARRAAAVVIVGLVITLAVAAFFIFRS